MNPAIFAALAKRVAAMLAQLAKRNPQFETTLATYVSKASGKSLTTLQDIVKYAKTNPVNMTLLVTSLASLGVSIKDWITGDDGAIKPLPNDAKILIQDYTNRAVVDRKIVAGADVTSGVDAKLDNEKIAVLQPMVKAAVRFFGGSRATAIANLRMLDFWMNVPDEQRVAAISNLRID